MALPSCRAEMSAIAFGGKAEDYLDLHELMDSTRPIGRNSSYRALTHNLWFIETVVKLIGPTRINSEGKEYSVRKVLELHCMQDVQAPLIPTGSEVLDMLPSDWQTHVIANTKNRFDVPPKLISYDYLHALPARERWQTGKVRAEIPAEEKALIAAYAASKESVGTHG